MGDGPEGVSNGIANVTTFPAPLYVASSFDEDLAFRYGLNTAREQTAKGRNVILAYVPIRGSLFSDSDLLLREDYPNQTHHKYTTYASLGSKC